MKHRIKNIILISMGLFIFAACSGINDPTQYVTPIVDQSEVVSDPPMIVDDQEELSPTPTTSPKPSPDTDQ